MLRSLPGPAAAESLAEVRQVCVETAGDAPAGREIAGWLARRLDAEGPILLTENAEEADACLKLAVVESAPHLRVTVRMVNAAGRLLWPPAERAGRTYEGTAEQVAAALAGDLLADLERYRGSP